MGGSPFAWPTTVPRTTVLVHPSLDAPSRSAVTFLALHPGAAPPPSPSDLDHYPAAASTGSASSISRTALTLQYCTVTSRRRGRPRPGCPCAT